LLLEAFWTLRLNAVVLTVDQSPAIYSVNCRKRPVMRKPKNTTNLCVLSEMTPDEVRRKLTEFTNSYVVDWDVWLQIAESDRVSKFASILRRWQGTRPVPMTRPKAEASHEPPYIDDVLLEASPHLEALSELTLEDLGFATHVQINALHGLWATFSKLPQRDSATCVGITKAIMLMTNGRIGPAFDSIVRKKLGLNAHLKSSDEWIAVLREISKDIQGFEKLHGKFATIVPDMFNTYQVGRLYDMLLGPGASASD
jgi:hypothetical protein